MEDKDTKKMNGYSLTRRWFDWSFENSRKARPIHGILFMWCIEKSNRLGWLNEFQLPSDEAASACGAADRETILKAIGDLEAWGFIKVTQQAKNRFTARWIKIIANEKEFTSDIVSDSLLLPNKSDAIKDSDNALLPKKSDAIPDAIPEYLPMESVATPTNNKLLNNKEKLLNNNERIDDSGLIDSESKKILLDGFEAFWILYNKKTGKKATWGRWKKLSVKERGEIMAYLPAYIESTPDIQYRRDPLTFLNKLTWEDEIIPSIPKKGQFTWDQDKMKYNNALKTISSENPGN